MAPPRTRKRKCCYAFIGLFLACVLARNGIVRYAAVQIGSRVLGTRVDVAHVSIGFSSVHVNGIRVAESGSREPQLDVKHVSIRLTPWQGIRRGVWADQVLIGHPTLHVRFDQNGALLSKFPAGGESGSTSAKIPIGSLNVHDAMLVVHQVGKEPFTVSRVRLVASFADEIELQANVPELLGGAIEFVSSVDSATYEGQSKLSVDGIRVDTARLVKLPLMPATIDKESAVANVSANLVANHPPGELDFRRHGIHANASIQDVQTQSLGTICNAFNVTATNQAGLMTLIGQGDIANGAVDVSLNCDSTKIPIAASATMSISDLDVGGLASRLMPEQDLDAQFQLWSTANVQAAGGVLSFETSSAGMLSGVRVEGVAVSDLVGNITSSGNVPLKDIHSIQGDVNGTVQSDGVNLVAVSKRFQLPESQGDIGLSSHFHISLSDLMKPKAVPTDAVSLAVSITTTDVSVGELRLQNNAARLSVQDSVATAQWKDAIVFDSNAKQVAICNASAHAPLDSGQSISSELSLSVSPTLSLARLIGIEDDGCIGIVSANAAASCLAGNVTQPEAWTATASLVSRDLTFANESIADIDATVDVRDGHIAVPPFEVQWRDNVVRLAADGTVRDSISISGQIAGERLDLSNLADLASRFSKTPMPLAGIANLQGGFQLTANPIDFAASGSANLHDAYYAQSKIGQARLDWKADLTGVQLRSSSDGFFGGSFDLVANAQELDWTRTVVEGRFQNLQASRLAALVDRSLPITGTLDGGLSVTSIASLDTLAGRAWISSRGVSILRIPVEVRSANVSIQSSQLAATCDGVLADGQFQSAASGRVQDIKEFFETPNRDVTRVPMIAHGKIVDLPIDSLSRHFQLPSELRTLGGKLNANFTRDPAMLDGRSLATASASVNELRLNSVRLADRILGDVTIHGNRIQLSRIDGRFADGRLSGKADLRLGVGPTGTFDFAATRVNLRRASTAMGSPPISGSGTLQLRGRIGQIVSGRADVSLSHGVFAGVSIPDAKFPIDWSYSQPSKVARWQCRAGMVNAGGGMIRVASEGSLGNTLNMTTSARIERVDSSKLMQGKSAGAGIVSGTMNLQAKRARSAKQFSGDYKLTLANVKTMEIPVLDQLPRMVSLSPPRPGQGEDGGTVRGRIAGGLVHVDELAIAQSNVQILMSGNATLDGRLNFDLTASTESNGPADQLLDLADSPLMLAAPAPIALVAKANDLLKDRVVHVHVGGNAARPTLRLQPGKQLSQDAVKFFLKSSFGNIPSSIANQSSQSNRR